MLGSRADSHGPVHLECAPLRRPHGRPGRPGGGALLRSQLWAHLQQVRLPHGAQLEHDVPMSTCMLRVRCAPTPSVVASVEAASERACLQRWCEGPSRTCSRRVTLGACLREVRRAACSTRSSCSQRFCLACACQTHFNPPPATISRICWAAVLGLAVWPLTSARGRAGHHPARAGGRPRRRQRGPGHPAALCALPPARPAGRRAPAPSVVPLAGIHNCDNSPFGRPACASDVLHHTRCWRSKAILKP